MGKGVSKERIVAGNAAGPTRNLERHYIPILIIAYDKHHIWKSARLVV